MSNYSKFTYSNKSEIQIDYLEMPRSQEAEAWANAVYAAIQEVPYGKVTSYGHIALLLGERMILPHSYHRNH